MSVDSRLETIPASGQLRLANANFLFIIASSANVDVTVVRGGTKEKFSAIPVGLVIARLRGWDFAFIEGAIGTILTFYYGITEVREDSTDFRQALATISGTVTVANSPAATLSDTATKLTVAATQAALVAANLTRRRVTIFSRTDNVGDAMVFLRKTGGANDIGFIQPGTWISFEGTYGIDYRAVTGGDTLLIFEES